MRKKKYFSIKVLYNKGRYIIQKVFIKKVPSPGITFSLWKKLSRAWNNHCLHYQMKNITEHDVNMTIELTILLREIII